MSDGVDRAIVTRSIEVVSAGRSFAFTQDKLHQVAAACAPQRFAICARYSLRV
jgi:hypothetical protein